MKVAIDVTQVIYETGVSVYTRELVSNLVKFFPDNKYTLFGGSLHRASEIREFAKKFKNARSVVTPISPTIADFIWNRLHILPIETFVGKVDIFHSSDWAEPPASATKVTTLHDLSPVLYPEYTHRKIVETHKRKLKWIIKECDIVIVPSDQTKKDAVEVGIPEGKIRVIFEAPSKIYKKVDKNAVDNVRLKYRISGEYAISVGVSPRKNTKRIIKAFNKAKARVGLTSLVIVGRGRANTEANFLGHVPTEDLPALYSGASVLIYPSLYEGFGLPILEAFACSLPVVTSNISSMPEVAHNAAVLVDPYSVESIADGLVKSIEDKRKYISLGEKRVKTFTWERVAKETVNVYNNALAQKDSA